MKKLHFLSGIPRSGSTLISCLLNQHSEIHATATSPLLDIIESSGNAVKISIPRYTFDYEDIGKRITKGIINSFYEDVKKPIVIDKHRGWVQAIKVLTEEYEEPKILCTNRSVPEVLASFIKLIEKNDNLNIASRVSKDLHTQRLPNTIDNRADYLFDRYVNCHIDSIIDSLNNHRNCIHMIEYDNIINNPQETMNKIYNFLEIDSFNHNFDNIENTCEEETDAASGIENLHVIRNKLQKTSTPPEEVLGKQLTEYYHQFDIKYS